MAIKRIIVIGSAKGGVGKSSITASIARAYQTCLSCILDADIYGPNQHILFNINKKPKISKKLFNPIDKNKIKIISMGNILNNDKAAV